MMPWFLKHSAGHDRQRLDLSTGAWRCSSVGGMKSGRRGGRWRSGRPFKIFEMASVELKSLELQADEASEERGRYFMVGCY